MYAEQLLDGQSAAAAWGAFGR